MAHIGGNRGVCEQVFCASTWGFARVIGGSRLPVFNPNSTNRVLPFPDAHSGPTMDSAIVSGTLFTLMVLGGVLAGIALMMM